MSRVLRMGFSPCPNDTFIFGALAQGLVQVEGLGFDIRLADVEELNREAAAGAFDICKVSAAAYAGLMEDWVLLRAGGAMGRGVGPVLVAGRDTRPEALQGRAVAIPGERTTANLLFRSFCAAHGLKVTSRELVFDRIMPAVAAGEVDAGVVIHEGRFTYAEQGMHLVADLGNWWEAHTGLPIPLGAIAIRRELADQYAAAITEGIRRSIAHAWACPESVMGYVAEHAQEMAGPVVREHIRTFVTDFSEDVGEEGEQAMKRLLEAALGRVPEVPIFAG